MEILASVLDTTYSRSSRYSKRAVFANRENIDLWKALNGKSFIICNVKKTNKKLYEVDVVVDTGILSA